MISALTWNFVNVFGLQLVQVIIGIILARLLTPEMFGEIGVLFIFIGIGTVLTDGGFGQGLIRQKETTSTDFSTIFWFNLIVSLFLYACLFFASPAIAAFFKLPHLTLISRVLFLAIILYPIYFIQQVKFTRELRYKENAKINIISIIASGLLSIIAAFSGMGVWALVVQQLSFHFAKSVCFIIFSKWRPELVYRWDTIRNLWKFSIPMLGQTLLNVIFTNIYTVIIGRNYPIKEAGYFNQANKYSETLNATTQGILHTSTFPIFSKAQDNAPRLVNMQRKLSKSVVMLTFPVVILLVIIAEPLLVSLLGAKWTPSVPLFQLLLIANIFTPLYLINVNLLNSRGESNRTLRLEIIKKGLILVSIAACFSMGVKMMLVGLIIANFISVGLIMRLIKKSLSHYFRHQLLDVIPILLVTLLIGSLIYLVGFVITAYIPLLVIQTIIFLSLYALAIRFLYPAQFEEAIVSIKNIISKMKGVEK